MITNNSFYVQVYFNGGMNGLEVIPQNNQFAIAYDGRIIAQIEHADGWRQVSGDKLPDDVLTSIYQEIESKKS